MAYATTADVMNGKIFVVGKTIYVGKRIEKIQDYKFSNITTSGVVQTVPGKIITVGLLRGTGSSHISAITSTDNSFSFRSTNSAYVVSPTIRCLYIPD